MQGVFIKNDRPKSKKAIKEAIAANAASVSLEATSIWGNEWDGPVTEMPEDKPVYFVGPDPHRKRNFYGSITRKGNKITVK